MADLLRQSFLDRLTRRDQYEEKVFPEGRPVAEGETPPKQASAIARRKPRTWDESVAVMKRNVLRDLESLLNARRPTDEYRCPNCNELFFEIGGPGLESRLLTCPECQYRFDLHSARADAPRKYLERSIYYYGLRDIATFSAEASETPDQLRRTLERTIEWFEPRLEDVSVKLVHAGDSTDRAVKFVIEATLRTDPNPERVEFDTVLEIASKRFAVSPHQANA